MTEANSDSVGEEDIFKRTELLAVSAPPSIGARLHELYDENLTAKIIRAATTCLEHNVSHFLKKKVLSSLLCANIWSVPDHPVP